MSILPNLGEHKKVWEIRTGSLVMDSFKSLNYWKNDIFFSQIFEKHHENIGG